MAGTSQVVREKLVRLPWSRKGPFSWLWECWRIDLTACNPAFEVHGHQGARGPWRQNTLTSFSAALEMGVTVLELDVGITRDGAVVVSHDRHVSRRLYRDTRPIAAGDPLFPYSGRRIVDLTAAQINSLRLAPANRSARVQPQPDPWYESPDCIGIPTLKEVFSLRPRNGRPIQLNIEAKLHPTRPGDTLDPGEFAAITLETIQIHGDLRNSMLSSFDWRVLRTARSLLSEVRLVALVARSPGRRRLPAAVWTAGLDVSARPFFGNIAAAARHIGASVLAPNWRNVTASMVLSAHREGMRIVPWTVNQPATMGRLIDLGVDGIITDYPARLQAVLIDRQLALPATPTPHLASANSARA